MLNISKIEHTSTESKVANIFECHQAEEVQNFGFRIQWGSDTGEVGKMVRGSKWVSARVSTQSGLMNEPADIRESTELQRHHKEEKCAL